MTRTRLTVLFVASLVVAGSPGWVASLAAQDDTNPFTFPEDVRSGESLFGRHCARCHGIDAAGGEIGPDLTTGRFRNASTDAGLFRVIADGVPNTPMVGIHRSRIGWTRAVWQLVSYLRSLSGRVENLSLPGNPSAGERLYRGKGGCASCHMVNGAGGRLGPDLSAIGDSRSPEELETDLLDPDERVEPRWWSMRVTHQDGTRVEGIRMDEDTYSVRILDFDENLWSFLKRDLRERERIETSTMPGYGETFTDGELDDVVAYLYSLYTEHTEPEPEQ